MGQPQRFPRRGRGEEAEALNYDSIRARDPPATKGLSGVSWSPAAENVLQMRPSELEGIRRRGGDRHCGQNPDRTALFATGRNMEEHRQSNSQAEGRGFKSHRPLQLELAGDTGFSPCPLLRSCRFKVGVETLQGFSWSIREEDRDDENQLEQTHHYLHLGFPNTSVGGFRHGFLGFSPDCARQPLRRLREGTAQKRRC